MCVCLCIIFHLSSYFTTSYATKIITLHITKGLTAIVMTVPYPLMEHFVKHCKKKNYFVEVHFFYSKSYSIYDKTSHYVWFLGNNREMKKVLWKFIFLSLDHMENKRGKY